MELYLFLKYFCIKDIYFYMIFHSMVKLVKRLVELFEKIIHREIKSARSLYFFFNHYMQERGTNSTGDRLTACVLDQFI